MGKERRTKGRGERSNRVAHAKESPPELAPAGLMGFRAGLGPDQERRTNPYGDAEGELRITRSTSIYVNLTKSHERYGPGGGAPGGDITREPVCAD